MLQQVIYKTQPPNNNQHWINSSQFQKSSLTHTQADLEHCYLILTYEEFSLPDRHFPQQTVYKQYRIQIVWCTEIHSPQFCNTEKDKHTIARMKSFWEEETVFICIICDHLNHTVFIKLDHWWSFQWRKGTMTKLISLCDTMNINLFSEVEPVWSSWPQSQCRRHTGSRQCTNADNAGGWMEFPRRLSASRLIEQNRVSVTVCFYLLISLQISVELCCLFCNLCKTFSKHSPVYKFSHDWAYYIIAIYVFCFHPHTPCLINFLLSSWVAFNDHIYQAQKADHSSGVKLQFHEIATNCSGTRCFSLILMKPGNWTKPGNKVPHKTFK